MSNWNRKKVRVSKNEVLSSGKQCEHPDCLADGDYRAPHSRERINQYYWFCLDHVKSYNSRWNYCQNMTEDDIEREIRKAVGGDRPTWPTRERVSHRKFDFGFVDLSGVFNESTEQKKHKSSPPPSSRLSAEETKAMTILDMTPPLTELALKSRYKSLVKRYHPDANGGDLRAEDHLKRINAAYNLLQKSLKGQNLKG